MKIFKHNYTFISFLLLTLSLLQNQSVLAQCNNADFSSGDFTGWTGAYAGTTAGFDPAANDSPPSTNKPHCMITTAGFDATVGGSILPMIPPGGSRSVRLGNSASFSAKESITYSFTVNASNTNFTYQYAVVLDGSSTHSAVQQPYFKISMTNGGGANISCGTYEVNSSSSGSIGGFDSIITPAVLPGLPPTVGAKYKTWSSVTIPLQNYIGQTVIITFETRDCEGAGAGSPGGHWAYAYISANCSTLEILESAPSVCPGKTVQLTAPAAKSYSWKGPIAGSIVSDAISKIATVNAPGTYTVTLTAFGSAACTYTLTAVMDPFSPGSGVTVNSPAICTGGTATLTASGGSPYTWSTGATTNFITVTPGSTNTYSVSGGSCPSTATSTVTVSPIPTSPFTASNVCAGAGSTITYTGNAVSTATYNWNFDGGTATPASGQGPFSVTWPTSGTKNVTLTVALGTCTSPLTTNPVIVSPTPTVTATSTTVCEGTSGTITAAGASTYLWSENTANAALTITPTSTTSYTVTGTAAGCTGTAVGTFTVTPLQDPTFSYTPSTVCKTASATNPSPMRNTAGGTYTCSNAALIIDANTGIIDIAASPIGTYTITYTTPGPCPDASTSVIDIVSSPIADFTYGTYCKNAANPKPTYITGKAGVFSSTTGLVFVNPITTPGEINLSASTAGTYTVTNTIAAGGGCIAATSTNTIVINPIPVTTLTSATICNGSSTTLTAGGADTYLWSDATTGTTIAVTPGITTAYSVTGTSENCSSAATGTVTVNAIPTSPFTVTAVCVNEGSTITYTGTAPANATYNWNFGSGTLISGSGQGSYSVRWPSSGSMPVTLDVTLNNCTSPVTTNSVTVNPTPTVTVNSEAICNGGSATLTASGALNYLWQNGSTLSSITVNPTTIGNSTYSVTGTTTACSAVATATVSVNPVPTSPFSVTAPCIGNSSLITYTGTPITGANYNWNFGGGAAVPSTGQGPHNVTWATTGTRSVALTVSIGTGSNICTSPPTTVPVTTNPLPIFTVTSPTICKGQTANPLASNAALTYKWLDNTTANPTAASPIVTTPYSVTGTDINLCSNTATYTISVNQLPVITVNSETICKGQSATLTASGAESYLWSNNNNAVSTTISPSSTLTLTVTGTDANKCTNNGSGTIHVIDNPKAEFSVSPNPAIVTSPIITFTDRSSTGVTAWKWDFGDGDTLAPNIQNPEHTYPSEETTYTVTLTVYVGACSDQIPHEVVIGPEYSFYMPNAFSPDGDKINDTFFGQGKGIIEYEMMIFDRWGNFIFYADDIDKGWDGKANGGVEVAQQDTYVWKVALTDVFKKKHNFIGTVTILRGK